MNRAILSSAIEGLVSGFGYEFNQDDSTRYPTTICRYPAAFMSQPEFVSLEGRKHGRITYKVSLRLARRGAKLAAAERNRIIAEMEEQLMEMFIDLSNDERVAVVEELTIAPCSESVDSHGAVAVEAKANVITIF